nr:hypothetical protein [Neobacillus sp. Marseille-Q6967]
MFRRKEEVYSIKEFMNRGSKLCTCANLTDKEKKVFRETGVLVPLAVAPLLKAKAALAATTAVTVTANNAELYDKMLHAFDPLITLIQALSYPVAMIVVLGGAIMIMINQKEKGFSLMQGAGLGYVLVQMAPMVLNILVEAMKAL